VPDFEAAAAWYVNTLDFRVVQTMPLGEKTLAFLALPSDDTFRIEFIAGPGCSTRPRHDHLVDTHGAGGWHHVCLRVDDVDASIEELRRRGARIVSEARDAPGLGVRFAFFSDPWNNLLELCQAVRPAGD
jgi:catechol 2,3-dioxygenase-like lactoylglutathione lyase family enzyme